MPPTRHTIKLYQGDDFSLEMRFLQDDGETPVDLTGYVFEGQLKYQPGLDALADFSFDITPEDGIVIVSLTGEQTATFAQSVAYDIQITYPNNIVETVIMGTGVVTRQVTE